MEPTPTPPASDLAPLCVRTVTPDMALAATDATVIDLRSPAEFAADHLPGAHNVPLFDDVQRALVGTLYNKSSPDTAFDAGRRVARERIRGLVDTIAALAGWELPAVDFERRVDLLTIGGLDATERRMHAESVDRVPPRAVVVHCWRGGLRSRSVLAILVSLGLDRAVGLEGGYKAYRGFVREQLETWQAPPSFVLRGLTGVGKTLVLRELERGRPSSTFDLELAAGHRSSLLGMVGLTPVSQRAFDTRLAERIRAGFAGHVVFEGESRKVGDVTVPFGVWGALASGVNIELTASVERRVGVLAEDYLASSSSRAQLARQLPLVEARMKHSVPSGTLVELLERDAIDELVRILLERYYDPLYRHSEERHPYAVSIDATDPVRAAMEIGAWIDGRAPTRPGAAASVEG